jgi:hypothetical protein
MLAVGKIRGVQIVVRLDGMGATGFCGHTRNQIAVDAVHYAAAKEKPDDLKVIGLFRDQRESNDSDPFGSSHFCGQIRYFSPVCFA